MYIIRIVWIVESHFSPEKACRVLLFYDLKKLCFVLLALTTLILIATARRWRKHDCCLCGVCVLQQESIVWSGIAKKGCIPPSNCKPYKKVRSYTIPLEILQVYHQKQARKVHYCHRPAILFCMPRLYEILIPSVSLPHNSIARWLVFRGVLGLY